MYISSSEVYGTKPDNTAYGEGDYGVVDILDPRSCYPSSKRAAETLCASYHKEYGVDVYIGALFATGMATLPDILISYFGVDNQGVGFYSLSLMLASPLAFIPSTMATIQYREYAYRTSISRKSIIVTLLLSVFAMFALWLVVPLFINYFYPSEYVEVAQYSRVISLGVLLYGMADFLNRFIGAQGRGKLLRNSSFAVGGAVLVFNLALIPYFGVWGAVWSKLIVGAIYLLIMMYCYSKTVKDLKRTI
jgi:O-antigen/teichoic acid export membrane protein